MKVATSYVTGDDLPSADFNTLMQVARGWKAASASSVTGTAGRDGVHFGKATGLANATATTIDSNHDWRDRVLTVHAFDLGGANLLPGESTDYTDWSTLGAGTPGVLMGYTGTGALSNTTTGAAVANGAPPVAGTGAGGTSYRVTIGANIYLYADPSTGALKAYNATGATVYQWLEVDATADLGVR